MLSYTTGGFEIFESSGGLLAPLCRTSAACGKVGLAFTPNVVLERRLASEIRIPQLVLAAVARQNWK